MQVDLRFSTCSSLDYDSINNSERDLLRRTMKPSTLNRQLFQLHLHDLPVRKLLCNDPLHLGIFLVPKSGHHNATINDVEVDVGY